MKYDEKKCKGCTWRIKCDEGHYVCPWHKCHRRLGQTNRKPKEDK